MDGFGVQLDELSIAILTVHREPAYIHQTLAGLFSSGPEIFDVAAIEIFVDGNNRKYLRQYEGHPLLRLHYLSEQEHEEESKRTIHSRLCFNYCRCLGTNVLRGLVILEDDVLVRIGFLKCLTQAILEIEDSGLREYVLGLHSKANLPGNPNNYRGQFYVRYPPIRYYGLQGMYYPKAIIPEIREYVFTHGVQNYRRPGDLLIKELMRKRQILYNTAWDLVEHMGEVSTGLGDGRAWASATFRRPWVPLMPPTTGGDATATS